MPDLGNRKFSGGTYRQSGRRHSTKAVAVKIAQGHRRGGSKARVVAVKGGYAVFVRKT